MYVAFVPDASSRRILGWRGRDENGDRVGPRCVGDGDLDPRPRRYDRPDRAGAPQRRRQYTSIVFTTRLIDAGVNPSVGSVGDAYDNALAETTIGLYKTEWINRGGP